MHSARTNTFYLQSSAHALYSQQLILPAKPRGSACSPLRPNYYLTVRISKRLQTLTSVPQLRRRNFKKTLKLHKSVELEFVNGPFILLALAEGWLAWLAINLAFLDLQVGDRRKH